MSEKHENIQEIEPTVFNDEINNVLPTENEITNNAESTSSIKKELMKYNMNENDSKIFFCFICKKEYTIYFHLKQHIKKVTKRRKIVIFSKIILHMLMHYRKAVGVKNANFVVNQFLI